MLNISKKKGLWVGVEPLFSTEDGKNEMLDSSGIMGLPLSLKSGATNLVLLKAVSLLSKPDELSSLCNGEAVESALLLLKFCGRNVVLLSTLDDVESMPLPLKL